MKNQIFTVVLALLIISCNAKIKDAETQVLVEEGTEVLESGAMTEIQNVSNDIEVEVSSTFVDSTVLGFWVGYFQEDFIGNYSNKTLYVDEAYQWNRDNKINISIDKVSDNFVFGHSVVAGNKRPFSGKVQDGIFQVKEPGDDQYDGEFKFEILDNKLVGKWTAFKNIDIKNRKYSLEKRIFIYDPDIQLEKSKKYINWYDNLNGDEAEIENENVAEIEDENDEIGEWFRSEYASATTLIYTLNASNTLLKKEDVENLKKGDITIIRNTIYARHGYSFKYRPLRVFFDAQSWYIPVHTDIKSEFTEIEKANIKLLLRYEKNAVAYYDYFGRG
uniref:YARHG domain-containing protein n=1 Tax=Flavobacterium sp. TaxID=239 RepID=UPI004049816E